MDLISRAALVGIGAALRRESLLPDHEHRLNSSITAGLIVGSRRGSLVTDLDYARSLAAGPAFASPALFSYTLPNIGLAEAAIHYGLTGPVFSILSEDPFTDAGKTALQWLASAKGEIDLIVAGELDNIPAGDTSEVISRFTVVRGDM